MGFGEEKKHLDSDEIESFRRFFDLYIRAWPLQVKLDEFGIKVKNEEELIDAKEEASNDDD